VRVTDMSAPMQASSASLSIQVVAPPTLTITTSSLPGGVTTQTYSTTLNATGGVSPYRFAISAGALPPGLALNATTGAISGTPTNPGTSSFTVQVTDSATPLNTATHMFTLAVANPLAITTTRVQNAFTGSTYSAALNAQGGTTPDTWSISNGSLPAGL